MNQLKKWCRPILLDSQTEPNEYILGFYTQGSTVYILYEKFTAFSTEITVTYTNLITRHHIKNLKLDFPYINFPDFRFTSLHTSKAYYTYDGKNLIKHQVIPV